MTRAISRTAIVAFLLDLALVALFVALGRRTHEGTGFVGFLVAVRPFVTSLAIGWLLLFLQRALSTARPDADPRWSALWPTGVLLWLITAGGGLGLRAAGGGGLAGGFPYVTFGVLGAFLLGWRLLAWLLQRKAS